MTSFQLQTIIITNLEILLRNRNDISLKSLSLEIGASPSYMQKLMSGKCMPTLEKLLALANYFSIPITVLLSPNTSSSQHVQSMSETLNHLSPNALNTIKVMISYMKHTEESLR